MASACASTSSTPISDSVVSDSVASPSSSGAGNRTELRVGRLTKAHGLKGALKLELYTDAPEKRFVPGAVFTLQVPADSPWHGKTLELAELRWYNSHPVGFFRGIDDRNAAETLVKAILWVEHEGIEESDEPDAWFDHQLVGLSVVRDGAEVGTVARVDHMPAQDLLVVETTAGEVLVPFVAAIVPSVDVAAGVVTVTPPIGLFEEPIDDEPAGGGAAATGPAESPEGSSAPPSAEG
jgi:16S rRNA processing protein RimM